MQEQSTKLNEQIKTESNGMDAEYFAKRQKLVLNPLLQHRNIKCPCGSGIKSKVCCGKIRFIKEYLAIITLRYITKEMEEHEFKYMHMAYKHELDLYFKQEGGN